MYTERQTTIYLIRKENENLVFTNAISATSTSEFVQIVVNGREENETITYWFPVSDILELKAIDKIIDKRR